MLLDVKREQLECDCQPDCHAFKYEAYIDTNSPTESSNHDLLNIERVSSGVHGFDSRIMWDIETPGNWMDNNFLMRNGRAKFLTNFLLEWFKGN